jgi:hypothetical protein
MTQAAAIGVPSSFATESGRFDGPHAPGRKAPTTFSRALRVSPSEPWRMHRDLSRESLLQETLGMSV